MIQRKTSLAHVLAAVWAASLALGCTQELPDLAGQEGVAAGDSRIFTCVIADAPDSRFSITPAGKTSWEPGDKIMVHGGTNGADRLEVTLSASDISADGKRATFSIGNMGPYNREDAGVKSEYYAQYPAGLVPSGNMYYECCFQGTDAPLMAACNVGNVFRFYNLCGVIAYTVSGSFDKVVFSGNKKETVAFDIYQVRVRDDGSGPSVNYHKPGNGWKTYAELTTIEKAVVADGTTVNYIYLPKGVEFAAGFNFQFFAGDELVKTATTETAVKIDHGKILNLGNINSHLEDYVAPVASDHTSTITGATDLSAAEGPSNCYVVSTPGAYKLPVVCGNNPEKVPGTVFAVEILWETCCNAEAVEANSVITKVDFDGPSNYVFFETPSSLKPGNALIAAKNSSGKILWSWHIWIPQTDITTDSFGVSSKPMMDRNLGALVATEASGTAAPESFGMLYQWGRKDPFVGGGAIGSNSQAGISGTSVSTSGGQMSLAQSVANPTVFATPPSNTDWCTVSDGDYWGDTSEAKSMYDPCPPGYRVPRREEAPGLFGTDLNTSENFNYNSTLGRYTVSNPIMVVPLCGYRETGGGLTHCNDRAIIWNAHHDKDSQYAGYSQYVYYDSSKTPASVSATWSQSKARAGSIRCVLEKDIPFENAPGMPVQGSYTRKVFDSNVVELSGICFSKDKDFIWGVGDEGYLYKISLDMETVTTQWTYEADLEDVTIDPATGNLYFAVEPKRVYRMSSPYTSKTTMFDVEEAANMGNSGMEGISWYKDNMLYIGSQSGATLWKYTVSGTKIWKKQLGILAPQIQEVGGLCYDAEKDWLWVSDSEACKLFVFDGEVTELLAIYDVSFIGNAESVMVDRAKGMVYVGDDGSTSKIYKISFSNL